MKISDGPFNFNKHQNIIWKIGGVILLAGLFIAAVCGIFIIKISKGNLEFWLLGLLAGLGLIILSLPFILIGAIIG